MLPNLLLMLLPLPKFSVAKSRRIIALGMTGVESRSGSSTMFRWPLDEISRRLLVVTLHELNRRFPSCQARIGLVVLVN